MARVVVMVDEILPPAKQDDESGAGARNSGAQILNVGQFHYHGNDLKELRKLAQQDPALAKMVLDNADAEDRRFNASYRFGLVTSVALLISAMAAIVFLVVFSSIWSAIAMIGFILAIALLIRVILTGQWSDTTWFGSMVGFLAKALGSEGNNPSDP